MIANSCNYPGSCDCGDCENRKIKVNKLLNFIERKREPMYQEKRLKLIRNYYKDLTEEYYEQNIPTNLYELFYEFLSTIPKDHLTDCNTLGLFKSVLEEVTGVKNIQEIRNKPSKKYI